MPESWGTISIIMLFISMWTITSHVSESKCVRRRRIVQLFGRGPHGRGTRKFVCYLL
jgi:hypothetical protein